MLWRVPGSRRCLWSLQSAHAHAHSARISIPRPCATQRVFWRPLSSSSSDRGPDTIDLPAVVHVVEFLHRRPLPSKKAKEYVEQLPDAHPAKRMLNRDGVADLAWALSESPQYNRMTGRLLLLVYKLGVRPRKNVFEGVAHRLAVAGRWSQIPGAVELGRRVVGRTTKRLLNWKTRALIECSEWGKVDGMLNEYRDAEIAPDRRTWHMFVQACLLNSNLPRARDYLNAMTRAGFPPDDSTHVAIVAAYHALGQKDDVEARAFETLRGRDPASDTKVLNSIMQLRMRHGDLDSMCKVFRVFRAPCNIRMTGVEMKLLSKPNSSDPVYRPSFDGDFDHVDYTDVRPNAATFAMIMDVLAHQLQIKQVERAYNIMCSSGIRPDSSTIASLINAYANVGDIKTAFAVFFETCRGQGAKLFKPWLKHGLNTGPAAPPPDLRGVRLDINIYNALLSALLRPCGFSLFQATLAHMRMMDFEPDRKTSNIFLHYLSNRGIRPRQLIRICTVFATFPPHCRPSIGHINSILASIMRRRRAAYQLFGLADLQRPEEKTNLESTEGLPHIALKEPPLREFDAVPYDPSAGLANPQNRPLVELLALISDRNIRSNTSTFALRLWRDAVTRLDMESARATFKEMTARGIRPNSRHFTILMDGWTRVGDMTAAEGLISVAYEENGVLPTVVMYTVIIKGYARLLRPDKAAKTFFRMITAGIPPDVKSVLALVDAFIMTKKYRLARYLLLTVWKWVLEFPPNLAKADVWTLRRAFARAEATHEVRPPLEERSRRNIVRRMRDVLHIWRKFYLHKR
ncbi:hypothetical protein EXIGLDRAFT_737396 [Exidia glandulosa HHB12029]|uniref:Pentacotripeptide-repeat region of PRORP domain-containing protein n=1 Tax=Exidia glandulosa HHB12029 TaxID=1314781 RepID=A0A165IZG2_EXIGL|nr:hypothetical protein EXIGLDRAFT_737396 [Exidia glandulosa HHB12029]